MEEGRSTAPTLLLLKPSEKFALCKAGLSACSPGCRFHGTAWCQELWQIFHLSGLAMKTEKASQGSYQPRGASLGLTTDSLVLTCPCRRTLSDPR